MTYRQSIRYTGRRRFPRAASSLLCGRVILSLARYQFHCTAQRWEMTISLLTSPTEYQPSGLAMQI